MFLDDFAHRAANAFRFVAIEPRGFDRVFQLGQRRVRITLRSAEFPEQRGRDHVDAFVGGLRRENCGHEKLQRVTKIQLAIRRRVNFWPSLQKLGDALASSHRTIILQARYTFQSAYGGSGYSSRFRHGPDRKFIGHFWAGDDKHWLGFIAALARETAKRRPPQEPLLGEPLSPTFSSFVRLPG